MKTIPIRVCGDYWFNSDEVYTQLNQIAGKDNITLDFFYEGPNLSEFGITKCLDAYCTKYQVDPGLIRIKNWCNRAELVDYRLDDIYQHSHFFDLAKDYWKNELPQSTNEYVFGFFVGRRAVPRAIMMKYMYERFGSQNLLSCMKVSDVSPWNNTPPGVVLENLDNWVLPDQKQNFINWWHTCPVDSIDNHWVRDHYVPGSSANQDLLLHYHRFDVELVAETYTRGTTFFPTEKTVRPIMAAKPILVYGPKNFLKKLRDLGFETYNTIWDEGYDQFESRERWAAMREVIETIMSMYPEDRITILKNAKEIAERNRQRLAELIKLK